MSEQELARVQAANIGSTRILTNRITELEERLGIETGEENQKSRLIEANQDLRKRLAHTKKINKELNDQVYRILDEQKERHGGR